MAYLKMWRGDGRIITVTLDVGTFTAGDQVRFTAKRSSSDLEDAAVIAKSSEPAGGIVYTPGESTATVTLTADDTTGLTRSTWLIYDVQVTPSGGEPETIDSGTLQVQADVTRTAP